MIYRLLWEFVEKHGGSGSGGGSGLELEVVYTLSGWLKNDSSNYHITLVSSPKLSGNNNNILLRSIFNSFKNCANCLGSLPTNYTISC